MLLSAHIVCRLGYTDTRSSWQVSFRHKLFVRGISSSSQAARSGSRCNDGGRWRVCRRLARARRLCCSSSVAPKSQRPAATAAAEASWRTESLVQVVLSRAVCALPMVACCSGSGSGSSAQGSSGSSPIGLGGLTETVAAIACWHETDQTPLCASRPACSFAQQQAWRSADERCWRQFWRALVCCCCADAWRCCC